MLFHHLTIVNIIWYLVSSSPTLTLTPASSNTPTNCFEDSERIGREIPYLFVDASYYKVRDEKTGRYKTKALLIVAGIREDGSLPPPIVS